MKRIIVNVVLNSSCNLRCNYCLNSFISPYHVINKEKFNTILNHLNKSAEIHLSGGEPFLSRDIYQIIQAITDSPHQMFIYTNMIPVDLNKFELSILKNPNIFLKVSFHYEELLRTNNIDLFFYNCKKAIELGTNFVVRLVLYPPILSQVYEFYRYFEKLKIPLEGKVFFGKYDGKVYPSAYSESDKRIMKLILAEKSFEWQLLKISDNFKGLKCSAGKESITIVPNGNVYRCFSYAECEKDIMGAYCDFKLNQNNNICNLEKCTCLYEGISMAHKYQSKKIM